MNDVVESLFGALIGQKVNPVPYPPSTHHLIDRDDFQYAEKHIQNFPCDDELFNSPKVL